MNPRTLTPSHEILDTHACSQADDPFRSLRSPACYTAIDGVTYKIAECREEWEAAFRLVRDAQPRAGFEASAASRMGVSPYHLLPTTDVFLALCRGAVINTATIICDGERGVPMDTTSPEVTSRFRDAGVYFGEVAWIADRRSKFMRTFPVLTRLIGMMFQYTRFHRVDQLLIALHPRDARVFQRLYGFEPLADLGMCQTRHAPAVVCVHDFTKLGGRRYMAHDRIYAIPFRPMELQRRSMLEHDREYFRRAIEANGFGDR